MIVSVIELDTWLLLLFFKKFVFRELSTVLQLQNSSKLPIYCFGQKFNVTSCQPDVTVSMRNMFHYMVMHTFYISKNFTWECVITMFFFFVESKNEKYIDFNQNTLSFLSSNFSTFSILFSIQCLICFWWFMFVWGGVIISEILLINTRLPEQLIITLNIWCEHYSTKITYIVSEYERKTV